MTTYQEMITHEQWQAYEREGWFVLEAVLGDTELADLRGECQRFIDKRDAEMDAAGTDHIGLCMRGRRYFVNDKPIRWVSARRSFEDIGSFGGSRDGNAFASAVMSASARRASGGSAS